MHAVDYFKVLFRTSVDVDVDLYVLAVCFRAVHVQNVSRVIESCCTFVTYRVDTICNQIINKRRSDTLLVLVLYYPVNR